MGEVYVYEVFLTDKKHLKTSLILCFTLSIVCGRCVTVIYELTSSSWSCYYFVNHIRLLLSKKWFKTEKYYIFLYRNFKQDVIFISLSAYLWHWIHSLCERVRPPSLCSKHSSPFPVTQMVNQVNLCILDEFIPISIPIH